MESVIHNNIEGFLLLLLSMWPILLVVFIGVAISFYTMLLRKTDRKSTRLNSSHIQKSRMPSSA